jgi:hypothetical protein
VPAEEIMMTLRLMGARFTVVALCLLAGCNADRLGTLKRMSPQQRQAAMIKAAEAGDAVQVKACIGAGVSVNEPEVQGGWTALHFAVRSQDEATVSTLLAAGANPRVAGRPPARWGASGVALTAAELAKLQLMHTILRGLDSSAAERVAQNQKTRERMERIVALLAKAAE